MREISRRNMLKGLGTAGVLGAAVGVSRLLKDKPILDPDVPIESPESVDPLAFLNVPFQPDEYVLGDIADKRIPSWKWDDKLKKRVPTYRSMEFKGLLSEYTGIKGSVERVMRLDFRYQLAHMWKKKLELIKKRKGSYPAEDVAAAKKIFESFPREPEPSDAPTFRRRIDASLRGSRLAFSPQDVKRLPAFKGLNDSQTQLLQALEKQITTDSLFAYALTELMPTSGKDAGIGLQIFDEFQRHAGSEYWSRVPALSDPYLSFGPYQFTRFAIGKNKQGHLVGASQMNAISRRPLIPEDIADLSGDAHHNAAYLFAVYNLAMLVRRLGQNRSRLLLGHAHSLPADIVPEFIATAHHKPGDAINAFEAYADQFFRVAEKRTTDEKPDYLAYTRHNNVGHYTEKTRGNLVAVRSYFKQLASTKQ